MAAAVLTNTTLALFSYFFGENILDSVLWL